MYGHTTFGQSCLLARRLVEAGTPYIQVNWSEYVESITPGADFGWDTHIYNFELLQDRHCPILDRAFSALLDDLAESGQLDETLIVMAGEFGRTPKITLLPEHYQLPGRDHWGAVQTVFFAGGGVRGGNVIGSSDRQGAYPADLPQKPEHMAATIYQALGIPPTAAWYDKLNRPSHIYHGDPIVGLT